MFRNIWSVGMWWLIESNPECSLWTCVNFSLSAFTIKSCMHNIFLLACIHTLSNLWSHYFCLCLAISAFAAAALVLPGNYPYYLDLIHSLSVGPFLIGLAKFGIAFPVSYHTYNGIRHLVRLYNLIYYRLNICLFFPILKYNLGSLVVCCCHPVWFSVWTAQLKLFKGDSSLCS